MNERFFGKDARVLLGIVLEEIFAPIGINRDERFFKEECKDTLY